MITVDKLKLNETFMFTTEHQFKWLQQLLSEWQQLTTSKDVTLMGLVGDIRNKVIINMCEAHKHQLMFTILKVLHFII